VDADVAAAEPAEVRTAPLAQVRLGECERIDARRSLADERRVIQVVLADHARAYRIELPFVTRVRASDIEPKALVVGCEDELSFLGAQEQLVEAGLIRNHIAKGDAVVVDAKHEIELASPLAALDERERELIEAIARRRRLGRSQRVSLVDRARVGRLRFEAVKGAIVL